MLLNPSWHLIKWTIKICVTRQRIRTVLKFYLIQSEIQMTALNSLSHEFYFTVLSHLASVIVEIRVTCQILDVRLYAPFSKLEPIQNFCFILIISAKKTI